MSENKQRTLKGIPDIRLFFHRNETPIYFVSATNFNLMGIDEWVRNFRYITYIDCFDGQHPHVITPSEIPHRPFASIEDINNYLLEHKEVVDIIRRRAKDGKGGKVVFLFFDEQTEALCEQLGLEVCFPSAQLRREIDNKIMTTRIGDRAGIASVPNVLTKLASYQQMRELTGNLGQDVVIQTAFGDSGHTTFFISNEEDWNKHAAEIVADPEVKIMKRIRCRGAAQEACVTRHGTIVGPMMTELVGFKELTPYRGGWCGNEIFPDAFTQKIRNKARDYTFKFGEQLRKDGFRGYFELDFLSDTRTGELYLGELNPRVTGASSMTNHAAFAHADAPLFLFHLLEFSNVEFDLDIAELNTRWAAHENIDNWSQIVIKHTENTVDVVAQAPETGIWRMHDDGSVAYNRFDYHRRAVESEREAFFLRIIKRGDYRYEGADLGILVLRGRVMNSKFELTERAQRWIAGIRGVYQGTPLAAAQAMPVEQHFKIM
ncbi:MAG: hypothetical protein KDA72_10845 [Planctomycetales bacterium]|nr:hypothetical protein [Planctomycetales bacterium]